MAEPPDLDAPSPIIEHTIPLAELEESARQLARHIDGVLTEVHGERIGFALFVYAFGGPGGPLTYVSNCDRADMIGLVEEWLVNVKGRS